MADTRVRIFDRGLNYPRGGEFHAELDPKDRYGALSLLRREAKERGLGDIARLEIRVWDDRRGWVTYTPD